MMYAVRQGEKGWSLVPPVGDYEKAEDVGRQTIAGEDYAYLNIEGDHGTMCVYVKDLAAAEIGAAQAPASKAKKSDPVPDPVP